MSKAPDSNTKTVVLLITLGSIAWMIAGAIAVVMDAQSKVIWSCVVGAALGAIGVRYTIRRSRSRGI
jgi:hypothetical protein